MCHSRVQCWLKVFGRAATHQASTNDQLVSNEPIEGHFTHETESPWPLHFKHSHWWKRRSRSKFTTSHYAWGTNGVRERKMDVKVYMGSYMASNGSWFMVTWILFKNRLLEVGLTQNAERSWHSEGSQLLVYSILSCVRTCMNRNSLK